VLHHIFNCFIKNTNQYTVKLNQQIIVWIGACKIVSDELSSIKYKNGETVIDDSRNIKNDKESSF
jgi:hypothetical protein